MTPPLTAQEGSFEHHDGPYSRHAGDLQSPYKMSSSRSSKLSAARIALGYAVIASLWVIFTDVLVTHFKLHPAFAMVKGVAFVWVTAYLLYFTIRRLVEAVQRTSKERDETATLYRTVVEASGEGICLLDDSGRISFLNGRLAAMLGRAAEELRGQRLRDFIDEPELPLHSGPAQRSETHECRLRTESDSKAWALISSTPLSSADRVHGGSLVVLLDVTERKRLGEELQHSQKLEALGSFAGGISHDFNNLLSIMTGYASLLEKRFSPGSQERNATREILSACERGSLLIRQLLAFSRKQGIVTEVVDVCGGVRRFGEVLPRIVGENIAVAIECDESTGAVRIGTGQIEQILMNLAANARDAMPHGGALTIATRTTDVGDGTAWAQGVKPGAYVAIQVSDTGTGIDPNLKARIFEPFFTTKPQGAGTGLGLATVYAIAAQNGGFITCDSSVGVGTTFTVYLPFTEGSITKDEPVAEAPRTISGTETVLLVEDDPALRALTKHILSSHGYVVLEAANGMEAVQLMEDRHTHLDLLLTDVVMPGMSGFELADKISLKFPGTRIAFMSGHFDIPNQEKAYVIQKPVAPDALLLQLRAILDSRTDEHCVA
jgi:two-component system, cell cycle sensor histidine kinase and response regulator CckA